MRLPSLPLLLLAATLASAGAGAESEWKPFAEKDARAREARERERKAGPRPEPQRLPPLNSPVAGGPGAEGPGAAAPQQGGPQGSPYPGPYPAGPAAQPPTAGPYGILGDRPPPTAAGAPGQPAPAWQRGPVDTGRPLTERERSIERGELAPVMVGGGLQGGGAPMELWGGLDTRTLEGILAGVEMPPRSAAIHAIWRRVLLADVVPPAGGAGAADFLALRLEVLYRSGLIADVVTLSEKRTAGAASPLTSLLQARAQIANGDAARACEIVRTANLSKAEMPRRARAEAILLSAYCAAAVGNAAAAGLAADLAREEGAETGLALSVLDALAAGAAPRVQLPKKVSALDYRFLQLGKAARGVQVLERAEPALLYALAQDDKLEPPARLAAAEAAARLLVIDAVRLGEIYRAHPFQPAELGDPLVARVDPALRRALLVQAVGREPAAQRKGRLMRAALDDARRAGLYLQVAQVLAADLEQMNPSPDIAWLAETGVEIALSAADYPRAVTWARTGAQPSGLAGPAAGALNHWLALIDIADTTPGAPHGSGIRYAEELATRGRLSPDLMHRLATVLDALAYNVPIPLWEAASKTPQPTTGHLPETGLLAQMQEAAKARQQGRTILLAMRALGPTGAEGTNVLALGDAIRALRQAGLGNDARRLGFEALFMAWPRQTGDQRASR